MKLRPLLPALVLLPGLSLLGYLWPLPDPLAAPAGDDTWNWPEPAERRQPALPGELATFWPGKAPADPEKATADAEAAAAAGKDKRQAWTLIGVIRQGRRYSALVQDPQRNILSLAPGDALDGQRRVERIEPTRLHWQDADGQTGALSLYPDPLDDTTAPVDIPRAAAMTETRE
ncbi:hypothetical protein [Azotobacter armeniacus]